jgi:hypothetical protein
VGTGTCVRLRRGLYAFAEDVPTHAAERHVLVARGLVRQHRGRIALSHHTGALAMGLPTWGVPYESVRAVRSAGGHTSSHSALSVGRAWPDDAYAPNPQPGLPTLTAAVCCLQIAMTSGVEQAVVTLDAALARDLTTRDELSTWLDRLAGHRNVTQARRAFELSDYRSESPGESRLRVRLHHLGYTDLEPQVWVKAQGRVLGRVDLLDRRRGIVIEFDGRVKYEGEGGRDALYAEKQREDEFRGHGLGFARYVWADLDSHTVLRGRLERAARVAASARSRVSYAKGA